MIGCTRKLNRVSNTLKCVLECVAIVGMVTILSICASNWSPLKPAYINNEERETTSTHAALANVSKQSPEQHNMTSSGDVINESIKRLDSKTHAARRLSHRVEYNIEDFNFTDDTSDVITEDKKVVPVFNISALVNHSIDTGHTDKVTHIGFLKVHKAGSTTMQNIFFRFGLRNNLTFVLSKTGHYIGDPKRVLPVRDGSHRDILACHSRAYKSEIFDKLLPADSVKIGIIREPLNRMISAAYYYRDALHKPYLQKVPTESFIESLISNSSIYDNTSFSRTKNSMGRDFGFSPNVKRNDTSLIKSRLKRLQKDFSLVLVMERFEESLVLMKRLLKWQLSDIIYIQSNQHEHVKVNLSSSMIDKFKKVNFLDQVLYQTFNDAFQSKVKKAGNSLKQEVKQFRNILQLVKIFCETDVTVDRLLVAESKWNNDFHVSRTDCILMATEELTFVSQLRERHINMHQSK